MDKRDLAALFRTRLKLLLDRREGGLGRFCRESGIDRSALSQFLDPRIDRLPRAETLRAIAAAGEVSADWLLGLSHSDQGTHQIAPSVEIETAVYDDGGTPLAQWRREAAGHKLRYVPALMPDMLGLPEVTGYELDVNRAPARIEHGAGLLDTALVGDMDVEIAMPVQTLEDFARGTGIWDRLAPAIRRRQLRHMARVTEATYPVVRLHLYDGRRSFAAPFTVFGPQRAALYLGKAYLVMTAAEPVRRLSRLFDMLVREALAGPDRTHETLTRLADTVHPGTDDPA